MDVTERLLASCAVPVGEERVHDSGLVQTIWTSPLLVQVDESTID